METISGFKQELQELQSYINEKRSYLESKYNGCLVVYPEYKSEQLTGKYNVRFISKDSILPIKDNTGKVTQLLAVLR